MLCISGTVLLSRHPAKMALESHTTAPPPPPPPNLKFAPRFSVRHECGAGKLCTKHHTSKAHAIHCQVLLIARMGRARVCGVCVHFRVRALAASGGRIYPLSPTLARLILLAARPRVFFTYVSFSAPPSPYLILKRQLTGSERMNNAQSRAPFVLLAIAAVRTEIATHNSRTHGPLFGEHSDESAGSHFQQHFLRTPLNSVLMVSFSDVSVPAPIRIYLTARLSGPVWMGLDSQAKSPAHAKMCA